MSNIATQEVSSAPIHPGLLGATAVRVLRQLRADPRTLVMMLMIPTVMMTLLYFMFDDLPGGSHRFDQFATPVLGIIPFVTMFLVTSIAMLRERSSGTLERLLTTPISRLDLLGGYGLAFSLMAAAQAIVACAVTVGLLGLTVEGSIWLVGVVAVLSGTLGVGLGLLCSAFANSEFQAVQFMPAVVFPQLFVCGLFVPRADLPGWMEAISAVLPLTYAVDALKEVAAHTNPTGALWRDVAVIVGWVIVALTLASATLRRRTE